MPKPSNLDEYREWAKIILDVDFGPRIKNLYESNLQRARDQIQRHPFMQELPELLREVSANYRANTDSQLLMDATTVVADGPNWVLKPYKSAVDKSFRFNVLWNSNYPNPKNADQGWITPDNWLERFNDTIRTTLVCKYIDGPEVLAKALIEKATNSGLDKRYYSQQKEIGYYAFHCYIAFDTELLDQNWEVQPVRIEIEFQITTQLQEVLRKLTHKHYASERIVARDEGEAWQWKFQTNRFKARYLSHTLHMLEAMVVDVRDSDGE